MPTPRTARCGTPSGWSRHKLDGENPCDACYRAKAEYDKRRAASPERKRQSRISARAQQRAYGELAHRYPEEYRELYAAWKSTLNAEADQ